MLSFRAANIGGDFGAVQRTLRACVAVRRELLPSAIESSVAALSGEGKKTSGQRCVDLSPPRLSAYCLESRLRERGQFHEASRITFIARSLLLKPQYLLLKSRAPILGGKAIVHVGTAVNVILPHALDLYVSLDVDAEARELPIERTVKQHRQYEEPSVSLWPATDRAVRHMIPDRSEQRVRREDALARFGGMGDHAVEFTSCSAQSAQHFVAQVDAFGWIGHEQFMRERTCVLRLLRPRADIDAIESPPKCPARREIP
jgi:hypothetical protein